MRGVADDRDSRRSRCPALRGEVLHPPAEIEGVRRHRARAVPPGRDSPSLEALLGLRGGGAEGPLHAPAGGGGATPATPPVSPRRASQLTSPTPAEVPPDDPHAPLGRAQPALDARPPSGEGEPCRQLLEEVPLRGADDALFQARRGPRAGPARDKFCLRVQPGTCMAAWMALDPCDGGNGCMKIVPGTQEPAHPVHRAGQHGGKLHRHHGAHPPGEADRSPVLMEPGTCFFFSGS